jgi:integrase
VWAASPLGDTFGDLVKLLLLTGQRRSKVVSMRWDDLSNDGTWTWRIPTDKREKGNGGDLILPELAADIIRRRPRFASNPYVFPSGRSKVHFNGFSKCKAALDAKLAAAGHDLPQWQLHDLRRTARTLMSRAGVNDDHAERVLGHAIEGVAGTYNRHAYDKEKAAALAKLAGLVEMILNPSANVTPMRKRARG